MNTNDKDATRTPQHPEKERTKRSELLRLLHASWPFLLLAGIVVGLYFWMFAPKDYADLVPGESRAVIQLKPAALLAGGGSLGTSQWRRHQSTTPRQRQSLHTPRPQRRKLSDSSSSCSVHFK